MASEQTLGLYLGADLILNNPGYLEALRSQIGLDLVIIGFCGEVSDRVRTLSPFDDMPPSDERLRSLVCRYIDGQPITQEYGSVQGLVGPAVHAVRHEETMRKAIDAAHDVGLDVWLLGEAWTTNDFQDVMYCPSDERVNDWYEALYVDIASRYDVEALDITHARYPMTSHPRGMFVCTCAKCARSAADMGYDMAQMKADVHDALAKLREVSASRLVSVAEQALGASDYVQLLDLKSGVLDWFKFRAGVLAKGFGRFREAVHAAAGPEFIFGCDTYPASLALFAGHDLSHWAEFSDFASPLIAHADIFQMYTLVVWARFLREIIPALSEGDALKAIYRFVGYDRLGLPDNIDDFLLSSVDARPGFSEDHECEFKHVPLLDLLRLDMAKSRLHLPEGMPSYPILQGGGAPHDWPKEIVQAAIASAGELGHQGVMLQGTQSLVDWELKGASGH